MKRFTFILPLLFCAVTALASTALGRPGTTRARLFDSGWLFMRYGLQPDGTTLAEPSGLQKPEVADSAWTAVNLPHDYAITGPFRIDLAGETGKLPYQGIGWYRKHFTLNPAPGERTYIEFDGAMANARVWLNGHYVGEWPYGYSSFRLDLTPYIQPGRDNVLAVRLDTERWESRWYSGAGIYRHVWLVSSQPVHVAHWGTYITTPVVTDERAEVRTECGWRISCPAASVPRCVPATVSSIPTTPWAGRWHKRPTPSACTPAAARTPWSARPSFSSPAAGTLPPPTATWPSPRCG